MFLKRKEKQTEQNEKIYGYTLTEPFGDFDTGRVGICFAKGILMFGAALGTTLSMVSAFDLQVNLTVLIAAFFLLSMLLSFMHYNRVFFNIGYPLAFLIFTFSIIQNRSYVNSGFQAVVNQIREDYTEYFVLNFTGEAVEAVDNRYMAMTCAFLYLGFFLIVLLNIAISNYMSIFLTMLFTFPFLQFGLYIGKTPSFIAIFLLLFVYAGVLFLKRSGHYSVSTRRKKDRAFTVRKNVFSYKGKGKVMGQLLRFTCVITLVFSLAAYPIMHLTLPGSEKTSALKASTDTVIKNLVLGGISSLFNRYEATGGISGGRLGGVNRVKSDYETDLEVTFVPGSLETVYLKAYTGAEYTGDRWERPAYDESQALKSESREEYEEFTARLEANRIASFAEESGADVQYGKMTIKNIDADIGYLYLPYYSAAESGVSATADHSVLSGRAYRGMGYSSSYYPYTQDLSAFLKDDILLGSENTAGFERRYVNIYTEFCMDAYTRIPKDIQPELEKYTEIIGEGNSVTETVGKIYDYLAENYTYSLNPGATPQGKDFVTWFLKHQKKGFCAHFATAGTLLCRAYGIPARYVEGYVIQTTDIAGATLQENEDVSDWFSGTGELERTGVVTVSVPDANAHAWTEIYIENFGWIPVDFTPPSEDVDIAEDYSSFLNLFAGLFSAQQGNNSSTEPGQMQQSGIANAVGKILGDNSFVLLPLGILILVLLALALGWRMSVVMRPRIRRNISYRKGRYDEVLSHDYKRLVRTLEKNGKIQKTSDNIGVSMLPRDAFALLSSLMCGEDFSKAEALLEKGLYGKEQLSKADADFVIGCIDRCVKKLKRSK